jgi:hypothetical protein
LEDGVSGGCLRILGIPIGLLAIRLIASLL